MAPEQGLSDKSACGKETNANGCTDSSHTLHPDDAFHPNDSLNWIYKIRKDQLILACDKFNIDVTGQKVSDLRKSLSAVIKQKRLSKSTENLVDIIQEELKREEEDIIASPSVSKKTTSLNNAKSTQHMITNDHNHVKTPTDQQIPLSLQDLSYVLSNMTKINSTNDNKLSSLVQSWNITYRGNDDLYAFLSKIESRAENSKVSLNSLVSVIPQLLTGQAQQWFEVQGRNITTWEEFRDRIANFFLPSRFLAQIENNYYSRKQRPREKARDYILDLLTLAKQHPDLKMKNHLERLYDGLLPEYRLQISRSSITNITELSCKCNEYEQIRQEEARNHRPNEYHKHDSRNHQTNHMFSVYDRKTHCWRCKQAGHQRFQCRNPTLLFCSECGKDNVLSTECCRENKLAHPANRIFLNVKIKTLPFHALIDTGTSQTAISSKMIPDLKKIGLKLEKFKADIEVANQTLITSKYRVRLPVTVHDSTWHYAVVMENLAENLILGIDFLLSRNYTLQIDGKALKPNRTRGVPSIHAFTTRGLFH